MRPLRSDETNFSSVFLIIGFFIKVKQRVECSFSSQLYEMARVAVRLVLSFSLVVSSCEGFSLSNHARNKRTPKQHFVLAAWSGSSNYMEQLSAYTTYTHGDTHSHQQTTDETERSGNVNNIISVDMNVETQQQRVEEMTPRSSNTIISVDMNVEKDFDTNNIHVEQQDRFLKMLSTEVQVKNFLGENPYAWTDIPFNFMIQRFLDNLEDSLQKNNGKTKGESKLRGKDIPAEDRPTVIVLGTGWAAHAFIKLASTYDLQIVVVSPVNHFVRVFVAVCSAAFLSKIAILIAPTWHPSHIFQCRSLLPC